MEYRIVNVVATGDLGTPVDLHEIGFLPGGEYDPTRSRERPAYLKDEEMTGKVSIFPSGKMISIGTASIDEASRDLLHVSGVLREHGFATRDSIRAVVRNIVAAADFGEQLDIEGLAASLQSRYTVIYEPDQFPAAILHLRDESSLTALLFSSGKVVVVGASSLAELTKAMAKLQRVLSGKLRLSSRCSMSPRRHCIVGRSGFVHDERGD